MTPAPTPDLAASPASPAQGRLGVSFGAGLLAAGVLAMALSGQIAGTTLGATADPGPRAFPMGLGALLALGGIAELAGAWRRHRHRSRGVHASPVDDGLSLRRALREAWKPGHGDALILMVAVLLYVPALSWLGFALSTTLFAVGMMRRLGARWIPALIGAVGMVAVIQVLFVNLFRVQLPIGRLGLPF